MSKYDKKLEVNQEQVTLEAFMDFYNQNIPKGFPRASVEILKKFQMSHPTLFKQGDTWSIARHQKKLIDWLPYNLNI